MKDSLAPSEAAPEKPKPGAAAHYAVLRRLGKVDGSVAKTLQPVTPFFASRSAAVEEAAKESRGGARKGSAKAEANRATKRVDLRMRPASDQRIVISGARALHTRREGTTMERTFGGVVTALGFGGAITSLAAPARPLTTAPCESASPSRCDFERGCTANGTHCGPCGPVDAG